MNCVVCESNLCVQWSDTHGVAVCIKCGMPYGIQGYSKREQTKPALTQEGIDIARKYWNERKGRVYPAAFDIGFGRNRTSYSGASEQDIIQWNEWLKNYESKQEAL